MEEREIDIRGIVDLLRRRLGLIVATLAACLCLAGFAVMVLPPAYSASTLILIDPSRSNLIDPDMQATSAASDNARVDSEVEILRSDAVLLDVVADRNLVADPEFGPRLGLRGRAMAFLGLGEVNLPSGDAALRSVLDRLEDAVSVQRQGLTYLIAVGVRSTDPQKAADLANAVARSYLDAQMQAKLEGVLAASAVLDARLAVAREAVVRAEEELVGFITANSDQPGDAVMLAAGGMDGLPVDLPVESPTRLYELRQSADLARSQYQSLLARSGDLRVQSEFQIADSRIVSPALTPTEPSFPNTRLILALAGFAGLGLGVGLAFIAENFVGGFTGESQLNLVTRLPVVGEVPFQRLAGEAETAADMLTSAPLSRYSEAVRRVRAGIDQHLRGAGVGKVIMVASAVPGEGKTTIALSLARAYAQAGRKTLIVDCDLRHPALHTHLGIAPEAGLFDYLAGRSEAGALASTILRDDDTGLSVIVGSKRSDVPTDQLIAGNAFARLVAAAADNFEVVILDTPPVLPVVDGLYLSQYADAVLLVVRWSATAQAEVRAALGRLEQAKKPGAPILAMLNQQAGRRMRYGKAYDGYDDG